MSMETKRLFIGGLFAGISEADLKERLGRFGSVSNVEIKTRKSDDGEPVKTFAHLHFEASPEKLKKCMSTYNGSKWKGSVLSIQIAKENFLDRLQKERVAVDEKLKSSQDAAVPQPKDIRVPGSKPGDPVPGEENWVVGKYGRALPVVNMRRKDGKKTMKVDPSKYCHNLKVLKDTEAGSRSVDQLTWEIEENDSDMMKKKMGVFPAMKRKTRRKSVADSEDGGVHSEVRKAFMESDDFEVVSHRDRNAAKGNEDLDSDDTDEIIAMKCSKRSNDGGNSSGTKQPYSGRTLRGSSERSDCDAVERLSPERLGQKYRETVVAVSRETDEIILSSESGVTGTFQNNRHGHNTAANSDSDASTDIDDILSRIHVKKKKVGSGKKSQHDASVSGVAKENESSARNSKRKSSKKEEKLPRKTVVKNPVKCDSSSDEAETFCEPKQGNFSWTQPMKKMKISSKDVVTFDDDGGVVDKHIEADDLDSAGSADTDELFSTKSKTSDIFNVKFNKSSKPPSSPRTTFPKQTVKSSKVANMNVPFLDEFASGLDDLSVSTKLDSDLSKSDSDSGSEGKIVKVAEKTKRLTHNNYKEANLGANARITNSMKTETISAGSDDDSMSSEMDSEAASSDSGGMGDSDDTDSDSELDNEESDSGSENVSRDSDDQCMFDSESGSSESEAVKFSKSPVSEDKWKVSSGLGGLDDSDSEFDNKESDSSRPSETVSSDSDDESDTQTSGGGPEAVKVSKPPAPEVNGNVDSENSDSDETDSDSDDEESNHQVTAEDKLLKVPEVKESVTEKALVPVSKSESESGSQRKEKKKNKEKTTKNVSKLDKHKADDKKRMESFQQRRLESQGQRNAIREALAAVDSGKTSGKKIVFSSDSESNDELVVTSNLMEAEKEKKPSPSRSSVLNTMTAKAKKTKDLFDSESGDDEDEEEQNDEEMFRVRPQFEGKAGQKLMKLQRRYADDERFKLDEKFLESESDNDAEDDTLMETDEAGVERSERDRQMDVLKDMFGSRAVATKGIKKPAFQSVTSVHFDPTREDHSQFEVHSEPKKKKKVKKKKAAEEEESEKKEAELPEVSKERFYEISSDLKGIFQGNSEATTFSFLPTVQEDGKDTTKEQDTPEPEACKPINMMPWQTETLNYDTSSGEEEEDDRMVTEQVETKPEDSSVKTNLFFFTMDDARIKEGVEAFYRKEDMSMVRKEWFEKRPALIESYRMRRKRALRKQRQEILPSQKRAKGKWK